jgi:hypothetical protein
MHTTYLVFARWERSASGDELKGYCYNYSVGILRVSLYANTQYTRQCK